MGFVPLGFATLFLQMALTYASLTAPPIQYLFTILILIAIGRSERSWPYCLGSLLTGIVLAYVPPTWRAFQDLKEGDTLREKYPFESIAERLPRPPEPLRAVLPAASAANLESVEADIHDSNPRTWRLERLHGEQVQRFVNSPGFGETRMSNFRYSVTMPTKALIALRNPTMRAEVESPLSLLDVLPDSDNFTRLHLRSIVAFADSYGWGLVKDRDHVAGFTSHGFGKEITSDGVQVLSVELMGLLIHKEPVVYVSRHLPQMDELKKVPVRGLDDFEARALDRLKNGEDLAIEPGANGFRVVGAIRNAKQCIACHDGNRGDLLGAFSYVLRREPDKGQSTRQK